MNAKSFSLRNVAYAGIFSLGLVGLSGCAHMTPTQQRVVSGGAIGAAGGAALGAITGGSPAVGAAVGGVAGGAAGAMMGNH
ncbi:YMGG-like glycine zipper-containing protein [Acidithiobacillus caldus]